MINYHKELVAALSEILPTYYEMALTANSETPCISYMELNNYAYQPSDTIEYSYIEYQVKVWSNDIGTIQTYAAQIDDKLRPLGFKRTAATELYDNQHGRVQKILTYEALALETFKEAN